MTNFSDNALRDSLFLRALRRESVPRPPLWLMRQAGRYLPEYRQTRRAAGSFLALAKTPAAASEVTLQPIARFGFDAAIIFSDILIVPDAMGLGLEFVEGEGPRLARPVRAEADARDLQAPEAECYGYLLDAIALTRRDLPADTPLIGFAGAPWTLTCYMIDGAGGAFWQARRMLHSRPDVLHEVLARVADAVAVLLDAQLAAGCQAAMIFDSWGGLLPDDRYEEFSLRYIRRIVAHLRARHDAPVIVFGRQCALSLAAIAQCGCAAAGVDWHTSLTTARRLTGDAVALQGNLDPAVLLTDPDSVACAARRVLADFGEGAGHIFNLGHGIDKNTPPENVAALVQTVRGS